MARQISLPMILHVVCAWVALVALARAEAEAEAERFIINLYVFKGTFDGCGSNS